MRTVAVVGASLAGLSAARALRGQGFDGRVLVLGAEHHAPYHRPPLSKDFLLGTATIADLAPASEDDAALDLEWRLGDPAVRLDRRGRSLTLASGAEVVAEGVVVATGARARALPAAGDLAGVHVLRTLDDAVALRESLRRGGPLVVVGAGFIGAEVAASARRLGIDVTVVEALPTPLAGPLGAEMGAVCAALHADHGVRLLTGAGVAGFAGTDRVEAVELASGRRLPAGPVVVGVGAVPNVEWLADSGLEIHGGVVTDATYATGVPGSRACVQCAVYERDGRPAAVLGMNQPRLFTRWRRQLGRPRPAPAAV